MSVGRAARGAAGIGGLVLVALAAAWVATGGAATTDGLGRVAAALVGLLAVVVAVVQVWLPADDPVDGPLVERAPERAPADRPLAGRAFAEQVAEAAETARARGVTAGVARVRPTLRATLVAVRRRAGDDRAAVERELDAGTWTDDRVAAAALSASVEPPERTLRVRLGDWLRPERVARRRVRRATAAVAAVADERLPPVPGASAPRPAPVSRPSLAALRRGADGSLEPTGREARE